MRVTHSANCIRVLEKIMEEYYERILRRAGARMTELWLMIHVREFIKICMRSGRPLIGFRDWVWPRVEKDFKQPRMGRWKETLSVVIDGFDEFAARELTPLR